MMLSSGVRARWIAPYGVHVDPRRRRVARGDCAPTEPQTEARVARRSAAWAALSKMLPLCILLIVLAGVAEARVVTIRWSSPTPPSAVTGFRIYTRAASQSFGAAAYVGKPVAVADVYSIPLPVSDVAGTYVTATAYNGVGESARSNEQFFAAPVCGNAVVDAGEGCDDGNTISWDGCSATCTVEVPVCGNGHRQGSETCDDGNTVSGDGCSSTCSIEVAVCGNGIRQGAETCDDGNTVSGDGCSSRCTVEVVACGNGIRQGTEACDDGNTVSWDGCSASCTVEVPVCGNAHRQGTEACDDGNTISWDGCSASCTVEVPVCGNAHRQGTEACDDGNTISWDGCSASCTVEVPACGNAHREGTEACDDGNTVSGDGCSATCLIEVAICGDGHRRGAEACDDGNTVSGDGCSASCTVEVADCGNRILQTGEGCDDGNVVGGDGCSASCLVESSPTAPLEYLIDAGSGGFVDIRGKVWSADAGFANGGRTAFSNVPIGGTTNDRLYQSRRYGQASGPPLVLEFPVAGIGPYRVQLHFVELDAAFARQGMRVFNVTAENAVTIPDVDIFASAGFRRAYSRIAYVNVDDGALTLSFEPVVGEPMIAGVEIIEQQPPTDAPEFVDPCVEFPGDCQ